MQINNLTSAMGTTVGWSDTMIKNISFTPYEWLKFSEAVNNANASALQAGLIIGAVAGIVGVFGAMKYMDWKKEQDWLKYGKS